ncbi:hypothetical protein [Vulgatibacter sp.]|uniref:hypothetical protein n=1 Tax=Vulgatibacter sp. TaxID=1971226 RepID=UPI00356AE0F8
MANDEGLAIAKAREVPRWRVSDVFTPLERDVMEYAAAQGFAAACGLKPLAEAATSLQIAVPR